MKTAGAGHAGPASPFDDANLHVDTASMAPEASLGRCRAYVSNMSGDR